MNEKVVSVNSGETRHLGGNGTPPAKAPRPLTRRERIAAWTVAGVLGLAVAVPALLALFYVDALVCVKILRAVGRLW